MHAGSIGDESVTDTPFDVVHAGRTATVTRWMLGIDPPPFWKAHLGQEGLADRWQIIHFQAPSTIAGDVGVALTGTGAPQGDRSQGVNGCFLAAITPESETSCHYFWNFVRTFKTDDAALTRAINVAHTCERRQRRLRPGLPRAGGAAARHRPAAAAAVLQPEHRRRVRCGHGG